MQTRERSYSLDVSGQENSKRFNKIRAEYTIIIESMNEIPKSSNDRYIFLDFHISPSNIKTTEKILVSKSTQKIVFNQKLTAYRTLFRETNSLNFINVSDSQNFLQIIVKEELKEGSLRSLKKSKKREALVVGTTTLALPITRTDLPIQNNLQLTASKNGKNGPPTLSISIQLKWVKFDDQPIILKKEHPKTSNGELKMISIDNEDYVIEPLPINKDSKSSGLPSPNDSTFSVPTGSPSEYITEIEDLRQEKARLEKTVQRLSIELQLTKSSGNNNSDSPINRASLNPDPFLPFQLKEVEQQLSKKEEEISVLQLKLTKVKQSKKKYQRELIEEKRKNQNFTSPRVQPFSNRNPPSKKSLTDLGSTETTIQQVKLENEQLKKELEDNQKDESESFNLIVSQKKEIDALKDALEQNAKKEIQLLTNIKELEEKFQEDANLQQLQNFKQSIKEKDEKIKKLQIELEQNKNSGTRTGSVKNFSYLSPVHAQQLEHTKKELQTSKTEISRLEAELENRDKRIETLEKELVEREKKYFQKLNSQIEKTQMLQKQLMDLQRQMNRRSQPISSFDPKSPMEVESEISSTPPSVVTSIPKEKKLRADSEPNSKRFPVVMKSIKPKETESPNNSSFQEGKQNISNTHREDILKNAIYPDKYNVTIENLMNSSNNMKKYIAEWNLFSSEGSPVLLDKISELILKLTMNTIQSKPGKEVLTFLLNLILSLFKELSKNASSTISKDLEKIKVEFPLKEIENTNSLVPQLKLFYTLMKGSFETYTSLLKLIFSELESLITISILTQKTSQSLMAIINYITECFKLFVNQNLFGFIMEYLFQQIFYFIDAQLFNLLLQRKDLCTVSIGFQIKVSMSSFESALGRIHRHLFLLATKQIKAIKEAANLLLIEKTDLVGIEDVKKTFPTLSFAQVKQILSQFRPEDDNEMVPFSLMKLLQDAGQQESEGQIVRMDSTKIQKISLYKDFDQRNPFAK